MPVPPSKQLLTCASCRDGGPMSIRFAPHTGQLYTSSTRWEQESLHKRYSLRQVADLRIRLTVAERRARYRETPLVDYDPLHRICPGGVEPIWYAGGDLFVAGLTHALRRCRIRRLGIGGIINNVSGVEERAIGRAAIAENPPTTATMLYRIH